MSGRPRSVLKVFRFSKREWLHGKCLITHGSNPQNKRYEDYPLLIWEEGPGPPDDNEIAEQYLHRALIDTGADSDSSILTGKFAAQRATMFMLSNALVSDSGFLDSG